jgi:peptide/nickel transport system permease protein
VAGLRVLLGGPLRIAFMLFATSLVAFVLTRLGPTAGATQPSSLHLQYLSFLGNVASGDLGHSLALGQPLGPALLSGLATTLALALGAGLLCAFMAILLGRLAAASDGGPVDRLVRLYLALGRSTPAFWLAVVLILFLGDLLGLPVVAAGIGPQPPTLRNLALPAICVAFVAAPGAIARLRLGLLSQRFADHVAAARARGLPESLIQRRHVFRNSLIPPLSRIAASLGPLLGLTVAVEKAFGLPGLGRLLVDSILARDFAAVGLGAWLFAVTLILLRLPAEIIARVLVPRRYETSGPGRRPMDRRTDR